MFAAVTISIILGIMGGYGIFNTHNIYEDVDDMYNNHFKLNISLEKAHSSFVYLDALVTRKIIQEVDLQNIKEYI